MINHIDLNLNLNHRQHRDRLKLSDQRPKKVVLSPLVRDKIYIAFSALLRDNIEIVFSTLVRDNIDIASVH